VSRVRKFSGLLKEEDQRNSLLLYQEIKNLFLPACLPSSRKAGRLELKSLKECRRVEFAQKGEAAHKRENKNHAAAPLEMFALVSRT
jgi:hypothetical protein